jgi:uncharacterized protein (TIGR02145 family)
MKNRNSIIAIPIIIMGILLFIACNSSKSINDNFETETGSFTDPRDGKIYKTVKVGDQWIMAENLAYKTDNGKFWAYENDENNIAIYGYLYDWETAMNIAPEGWHLPSRKEWLAIQKTLGAKRSTFSYLEKIYPKLIVGGSSGLDMLFGGLRTCDGEFKYLGDKASIPHGLWGSKAPYAYNNAFQRTCPGYSVRLFKDK